MPVALLRLLFFCLLIVFSFASAAGTCLDRVSSLGFAELAATFDTEKVQRLNGVDQGKPLAEQQACAVLQILGQPEPSDYATPDAGWIGNLGETSVYPRLQPLWAQTLAHPHNDFTQTLRQLIGRELANGYNIATDVWPGFDPARTLIYGHSDIRHAQQLLALLASEGLQARIGYSGKISAYLHRDGWGEPPEDAVPLSNERWLIEAREYDLHLEFTKPDDKPAFMAVLRRYAKQQTDNKGPLIYGSWWQPFVRSYTPANGFEPVTQVSIRDASGNQTAQVLLSEQDADTLSANIHQQGFAWQVDLQPVWVNPAFYRYLQGSFE